MPATGHSRALLALGLVLGSGALVACSGEDADPDPRPVAAALAEALDGGLEAEEAQTLSFTDLEPAGVAEDWSETVSGLGDVAPTVGLVGVAETEDEASDEEQTAVATLSWEWPVEPGEWSYQTRVPMVLDPGEAQDAAQWQLDWSRAAISSSLRERTVLDRSTVAARRGEILGAGETPLVTERPVVRVGVDRTQVPAARAGRSARRLARLVEVDAGSYVRQVEAAGEAAYVEAIVFRAGEVPRAVETGVGDVRGARLISDELSLAPTRSFAAPLLGTVGPVTAEMVEEEPERYAPGDVAGLSGLQARYDDQLQGTDGVAVTAVSAAGRERRLFGVDARDGDALQLTLDRGLQTAAEETLADVGPPSALVALRPSDGAVLAAASGPGSGGLNTATFAQYPPGSTFKIVSSLALLRAGLDPGSRVPCTPTVTVDGRAFENYDGYPAASLGDIALRDAVAQSCNTALIAGRDRPGDDGVAEAGAALGLGVDRDLGFPAYFGQVVRPESETERAATMIGQGRVLASPMAMAAVIGSVQSGARVVPQLVSDVDVEAGAGDPQPLTAGEADQLRSMLRGVVTGGSGRVLSDVPGPPVIAKTGTAEFERDGEVRTHAWMVAAQGDLAVAAFVEEGESGSGTAGPLLERLLRAAG